MRSSLRSASDVGERRGDRDERDDASTNAKREKKSKGALFKKISSSLVSRAPRRAISDFQITLTDPHRQFAPGERVTGLVTVVAEKDVKVTHLVVNMRGFVELYNGPTNGGIHAGKKKSKDPANLANIHDTTSTLCMDEQVLCGEGKLEAGVFNFQFEMILPGKGLPSSLDFEKGKIEYKVTASLTRPLAVSPVMVCSQTFGVRESIDVAPLRPPTSRVLKVDGSKPPRTDRKGTSTVTTPAATSTHLPLDTDSTTRLSPTVPSTSTAALQRISERPSKPIVATVELLKGGCLAGGQIPMKIKVQHVKPIKSMCGVIITLYRLGSFDTLSLASPAQKAKLESKKVTFTGSSTTAFRKELDQVVLPLMIDPSTFSCTLRPYIRVPEDAFPTIASVPLGLVSFKYYIEVVLDLGGKVAHRDDLFVPIDSSLSRPPPIMDPEDHRPRAPALSNVTWIFETDRIRRERDVKACKFEVVVGTVDSRSHSRGHEPVALVEPEEINPEGSSAPLSAAAPMGYPQETVYISPEDAHTAPPPVHEFSQPEPEPLDEKSRIRMAEDQLLPSAPPVDFTAPGPSAPPLTLAPQTFLAATGLSELSAPSAPHFPGEDKQELERQRLLQEASETPSAPPIEAPEFTPSAPPLPPSSDEDDRGHLPCYYAN